MTTDWLQNPDNNAVLRDIRRHFHTMKGNGRAVGANVLGELGWAAQDMLDRSLEGNLNADAPILTLVNEVVSALPDLVRSYNDAEGPDVGRIRELTNACFAAAAGDEKQPESLAEVTELIRKKGDVVTSQPVPKTLVQ